MFIDVKLPKRIHNRFVETGLSVMFVFVRQCPTLKSLEDWAKCCYKDVSCVSLFNYTTKNVSLKCFNKC